MEDWEKDIWHRINRKWHHSFIPKALAPWTLNCIIICISFCSVYWTSNRKIKDKTGKTIIIILALPSSWNTKFVSWKLKYMMNLLISGQCDEEVTLFLCFSVSQIHVIMLRNLLNICRYSKQKRYLSNFPLGMTTCASIFLSKTLLSQ